MTRRIDVKNDFIFKRIFGHIDTVDILQSLLEAILNVEITELEIVQDLKLEKDRIDDKQCILDIKATFEDGKHVNIEIQLVNEFNMDKRTLYYWSKMYVGQLKKGESYEELKKTITINILDFNFIKSIEKYHTTYHLREDEFKTEILTDIMELHFIEIPKFEKNKPDFGSSLERWLLFLDNAPEEVLEMIEAQDPAIKKATTVLDYLANDNDTMLLYEARQKAIHDEVSRLQGAKKAGVEEGLEQGLEIGLEQGKKAGIAESVKGLLENNIGINVISKSLGISLEEIEKIKKN